MKLKTLPEYLYLGDTIFSTIGGGEPGGYIRSYAMKEKEATTEHTMSVERRQYIIHTAICHYSEDQFPSPEFYVNGC